MIDSITRRKLVAVARAALAARVLGESMPPPPADLQLTGAGAFVTVYCSGELRGCLGSLEADGRLAETIVRLAADVACEDYRFPPLVPRELDRVTVDISVLTPSVAVTDPSTIVVGRDGLIVELGRRRGLLLPQVAVEHEWDRETFLNQTCVKAGLPPDAWRNGATVWRFEAEVFGDAES